MRKSPIRRTVAPFLCVSACLASGCTNTHHYEITLRPDGDGVVRELVCWTVDNSNGKIQKFPKETLEAIAAAYGAAPETKLDQKHAFATRFEGRTPVDCANSGTVTRWTSPLGEAMLYLERFGGGDDLAQQVGDRIAACSRLVDLLIGWLESELGREPGWKDLHEFLDGPVRRDVANLSLMVYGAVASANASPRKVDGDDAFLAASTRLLQYAVERGYLEPKELPFLLPSGPGSPNFLKWVERFLARRLGLADDAPRPESMAFLTSAEAASASLDAFLRTTPEYRLLYAEWEKTRSGDPDDAPPKPEQVISELVQKGVFELKLFQDTTRVKVVFESGRKPVATNGRWDEAAGAVVWDAVRNDGVGLPTFFSAAWCNPDADAQTRRFGKVALEGRNLYAYILWYNGLGEELAAEWDAFLADLPRGPEAVERIKRFRFSSDPPFPDDPEKPPPFRRADAVRSVLLEGLAGDASRDEALESPPAAP
jgi:hypothetical protein